MATLIICLIVFFIVLFGIKNFLKRFSSGCCGGGDAPRRTPVMDKDKKNYPFVATLEIGGMSCQNCAVYVENALNKADGVWAKVDLNRQTATVRMKYSLSDGQLTGPVAAAGYTVRGIYRT